MFLCALGSVECFMALYNKGRHTVLLLISTSTGGNQASKAEFNWNVSETTCRPREPMSVTVSRRGPSGLRVTAQAPARTELRRQKAGVPSPSRLKVGILCVHAHTHTFTMHSRSSSHLFTRRTPHTHTHRLIKTRSAPQSVPIKKIVFPYKAFWIKTARLKKI